MTIRGSVERYDIERRWGFIRGQDGRPYFYHASDLVVETSPLSVGARVEFEPTTTPRRHARHVRLVAAQPADNWEPAIVPRGLSPALWKRFNRALARLAESPDRHR